MQLTRHHLDKVKRLRAAGCTWRETADACRLSVHICRRLMDRGLLPDKRRSPPAGSRVYVVIDGRKHNLRQLSIDWLKRFRPERERSNDEIYLAAKILRRRIVEGWPAKVAVNRPPHAKLEEDRPQSVLDYDPPPAVVLGAPIRPEPHPAELLLVLNKLTRLI